MAMWPFSAGQRKARLLSGPGRQEELDDVRVALLGSRAQGVVVLCFRTMSPFLTMCSARHAQLGQAAPGSAKANGGRSEQPCQTTVLRSWTILVKKGRAHSLLPTDQTRGVPSCTACRPCRRDAPPPTGAAFSLLSVRLERRMSPRRADAVRDEEQGEDNQTTLERVEGAASMRMG